MGWIDRIRQAVIASGVDLWSLSKATGHDYQNLKRFAAGKVGLSLASAQRLCEAVGLDLSPAIGKEAVAQVVRDTTQVVRDTTQLVRDTSKVVRDTTPTHALRGMVTDLAAERSRRLAGK